MTANVIVRNPDDGKCLFYGMSETSFNNLKNGDSFKIKIYDTSDPCFLDEGDITHATLVESENKDDDFVGYIQTVIPQFKITNKNLDGSIEGTIVSDISIIIIPNQIIFLKKYNFLNIL
jgi:hypothetical protein